MNMFNGYNQPMFESDPARESALKKPSQVASWHYNQNFYHNQEHPPVSPSSGWNIKSNFTGMSGKCGCAQCLQKPYYQKNPEPMTSGQERMLLGNGSAGGSSGGGGGSDYAMEGYQRAEAYHRAGAPMPKGYPACSFPETAQNVNARVPVVKPHPNADFSYERNPEQYMRFFQGPPYGHKLPEPRPKFWDSANGPFYPTQQYQYPPSSCRYPPFNNPYYYQGSSQPQSFQHQNPQPPHNGPQPYYGMAPNPMRPLESRPQLPAHFAKQDNNANKISPLRLMRKKKLAEPAGQLSPPRSTESQSDSAPPLDVRRFLATWADEDEESSPVPQMVVLDCQELNEEQAALLRMYEETAIHTVEDGSADPPESKFDNHLSEEEKKLATVSMIEGIVKTETANETIVISNEPPDNSTTLISPLPAYSADSYDATPIKAELPTSEYRKNKFLDYNAQKLSTVVPSRTPTPPPESVSPFTQSLPPKKHRKKNKKKTIKFSIKQLHDLKISLKVMNDNDVVPKETEAQSELDPDSRDSLMTELEDESDELDLRSKRARKIKRKRALEGVYSVSSEDQYNDIAAEGFKVEKTLDSANIKLTFKRTRVDNEGKSTHDLKKSKKSKRLKTYAEDDTKHSSFGAPSRDEQQAVADTTTDCNGLPPNEEPVSYPLDEVLDATDPLFCDEPVSQVSRPSSTADSSHPEIDACSIQTSNNSNTSSPKITSSCHITSPRTSTDSIERELEAIWNGNDQVEVKDASKQATEDQVSSNESVGDVNVEDIQATEAMTVSVLDVDGNSNRPLDLRGASHSSHSIQGDTHVASLKQEELVLLNDEIDLVKETVEDAATEDVMDKPRPEDILEQDSCVDQDLPLDMETTNVKHEFSEATVEQDCLGVNRTIEISDLNDLVESKIDDVNRPSPNLLENSEKEKISEQFFPTEELSPSTINKEQENDSFLEELIPVKISSQLNSPLENLETPVNSSNEPHPVSFALEIQNCENLTAESDPNAVVKDEQESNSLSVIEKEEDSRSGITEEDFYSVIKKEEYSLSIPPELNQTPDLGDEKQDVCPEEVPISENEVQQEYQNNSTEVVGESGPEEDQESDNFCENLNTSSTQVQQETENFPAEVDAIFSHVDNQESANVSSESNLPLSHEPHLIENLESKEDPVSNDIFSKMSEEPPINTEEEEPTEISTELLVNEQQQASIDSDLLETEHNSPPQIPESPSYDHHSRNRSKTPERVFFVAQSLNNELILPVRERKGPRTPLGEPPIHYSSSSDFSSPQSHTSLSPQNLEFDFGFRRGPRTPEDEPPSSNCNSPSMSCASSVEPPSKPHIGPRTPEEVQLEDHQPADLVLEAICPKTPDECEEEGNLTALETIPLVEEHDLPANDFQDSDMDYEIEEEELARVFIRVKCLSPIKTPERTLRDDLMDESEEIATENFEVVDESIDWLSDENANIIISDQVINIEEQEIISTLEPVEETVVAQPIAETVEINTTNVTNDDYELEEGEIVDEYVLVEISDDDDDDMIVSEPEVLDVREIPLPLGEAPKENCFDLEKIWEQRQKKELQSPEPVVEASESPFPIEVIELFRNPSPPGTPRIQSPIHLPNDSSVEIKELSCDEDVDLVPDEAEFQDVMANCLANAEKFLDREDSGVSAQLKCEQDDEKTMKSRDVLLSSCELPSDVEIGGCASSGEVSMDFSPCYTALGTESLPVDNWPYLEEEVPMSPSWPSQEGDVPLQEDIPVETDLNLSHPLLPKKLSGFWCDDGRGKKSKIRRRTVEGVRQSLAPRFSSERQCTDSDLELDLIKDNFPFATTKTNFMSPQWQPKVMLKRVAASRERASERESLSVFDKLNRALLSNRQKENKVKLENSKLQSSNLESKSILNSRILNRPVNSESHSFGVKEKRCNGKPDTVKEIVAKNEPSKVAENIRAKCESSHIKIEQSKNLSDKKMLDYEKLKNNYRSRKTSETSTDHNSGPNNSGKVQKNVESKVIHSKTHSGRLNGKVFEEDVSGKNAMSPSKKSEVLKSPSKRNYENHHSPRKHSKRHVPPSRIEHSKSSSSSPKVPNESCASDQPWACEVCGFDDEEQRHNHVKTHEFVCMNCDSSFRSEKNLEKHFELIHRGMKIFHHCMICELSFETSSAHGLHLKSREHLHLEAVEKNTINTLFKLLTGEGCPGMGDTQRTKWRPDDRAAIHFYHQPTPLESAILYWREKRKNNLPKP